ncbi:MAG: cytidylate kinase-like family protein [Clostridia bacterium]|nr:cytidylate kinase-like family protein [Clostridia bacterium]
MEKFILTIGREFGSGGHAIARAVANRLGVKCYDKEIMQLASEESGLHKDFIASCDEKALSGFAFSGIDNGFYFSGNGVQQIQIKAYFSQFDAIKKIGEGDSCVIVGRVADYVLRDNPDVVSVFISANMPDRIERIMEFENISGKAAEKLIVKNDKNRSRYYNFFSGKKWGDARTYDVCINSSVLGLDGTVDYIVDLVEKFCETKKNKDK